MCWNGFGVGSVALAEDWNSALDLHFGSLVGLLTACHY